MQPHPPPDPPTTRPVADGLRRLWEEAAPRPFVPYPGAAEASEEGAQSVQEHGSDAMVVDGAGLETAGASEREGDEAGPPASASKETTTTTGALLSPSL